MNIIIDGFEFDGHTGELINTPEQFTLFELINIYNKLIKNKEYIKSSRIFQLINAQEDY